MNPLVSRVLGNAKNWRAETAGLRVLCLATGLEEQLKWGKACYALGKANVVLIHSFKDYVALLFMKGVLLKDAANVLIQQTPNVQSARQIRFTSLAQIEMQSKVIATYLAEAIALEKSGTQAKLKSAEQFDVPEEFQQALDKNSKLAEAFRALTPGRQKGYLLYFSGAKQSATRKARVERHFDRILAGLGLDD